MRSFPIRPLALCALISAAPWSAPAPALAGEIWGSEGRFVVRQDGAYKLRSDGVETELALPVGVRLEDLFALGDRALIGGVTSASRGREPGDELFLAFADPAGLREIAPPPGRDSGISRENPAAVAGMSGELTALAWLEGRSRRTNAVKAASFENGTFGAPVEIAAPGPGSQTGLAGTALDDGSALLVWARFDGADDEIYWSRRTRGRWSEPGPLTADNSVPDVTPAVVAVPGGAIAAWSRYEGGRYRVVLARFANGVWGEPRAIGEPGSSFPSLTRSERGALLLHQSHSPLGWAVVELDAEGGAVRRARVDSAERSRPVVAADRLRWSDRDFPLRWLEPEAPPSR